MANLRYQSWKMDHLIKFMVNIKYIKYLFLLLVLSETTFAQYQPDYITRKQDIYHQFIEGKIKKNEAINSLNQIQNQLKNQNKAHYIEVYLYKGLVYYINGESENAIKTFSFGISELKKTPNDTLLFKFYTDKTSIFKHSQQQDSAFKYAELAYQILQKKHQILQSNISYVIALYNHFGYLYQTNGDFGTSNYFFRKALSLASLNKFKVYRSFIIGNLAQNSLDSKKFGEAIQYLQEATELSERGEDKADKFLKITNILLQTETKNIAKIERNIQFAKRAYENSALRKANGSFPSVELRIILAIAKLETLKGDFYTAKKYYLKAIELNKKFYNTEKGQFASEAFVGLSEITNENDKKIFLEKAIQSTFWVKYNDDLIGLVSPYWLIKSLSSKVDFLSKTQNTSKEYLKLIKTLFRIRKSINSVDYKILFSEKNYNFFEKSLVENQANLTPTQAFEIIEYSKNSILADVLADKKIKLQNIDKEILIEETKLQNKLHKTNFQLQNTSDSSEHKKLSELLNETQIKLSLLAKKIEDKSSRYYQLKYSTDIASVEEIQNKIDKETAIISYLLTKQRIFISVVSKENAEFKTVVLDSNFYKKLSDFTQLLYKKPALGRYKGSDAAQNLYNQLVRPIEGSINTKLRLVFIRDSELNFIPFEILESKANDYLLNRFAISYHYSATIWANALKSGNIKNRKSLLSFAPFTSEKLLPNNFRDATLKPLPASENEVNKIGGTIYKANSATKNKFLEDYRKHGIIHFATHAQVDDVNPDKSFIAFYPENTDYKLFTNDLYLLNLQNTRLVVLSACEAGRGKLQKGEGLMSLARGFAYSGCPSVVTTLWNAHDESMAFLSEHLHHYLQEDLPIDIALQKAKLDYFNSAIGKELDHPYYWANFILIGNYEPVYEATKIEFWFWILVGILTFGIAFWIWTINKKRVI